MSSTSTQHALRSHLCARTRRTAPELPAAVPGLLAAPRFRQHPHSCAPHPRTPRTPLAAVIACSSVQRARRPRLRTRPSPVFSPRHEPTRPRSHTSTRATVRTELSPHAPTHTPRTHATPTQQQRVVFVRVVYNAQGLRPERRFVYISRGSATPTNYTNEHNTLLSCRRGVRVRSVGGRVRRLDDYMKYKPYCVHTLLETCHLSISSCLLLHTVSVVSFTASVCPTTGRTPAGGA